MPEPLPSPGEKERTPAAAPKKWPASVILTIPFFFIVLPLYRASRESVNWRAAGLMILTFSALAFCAGHFCILREHWIWNPLRTLGPTVWLVPIEEPLLYYWFPPLFTVILMHALDNWLGGRKK